MTTAIVQESLMDRFGRKMKLIQPEEAPKAQKREIVRWLWARKQGHDGAARNSAVTQNLRSPWASAKVLAMGELETFDAFGHVRVAHTCNETKEFRHKSGKIG